MNAFRKVKIATGVAVAATCFISSPAFSDTAEIIKPASKIQPCGGDAPPGCFMLVLKGDPSTGPSQRSYRFAAGFEFVKHWHSASENLVMTKGTMNIQFEGKNDTLNTGDYMHIPAKVVHWGVCPTECEFYLMEDGPISFNVVK